MVLHIPGKTKCLLCGKVIQQGVATVGFPAFLRPSHPLSRYSDAIFHANCFATCVDRESVDALYERYREIWEGRPRNLKSAAEVEAWGKEAFKDFS
jgi:hypothetical protein